MKKIEKTPYEVTPSTEDGKKKATILLTGALTLDELPSIKYLMIQNLDKYHLFNIIIKDVENIDLGALQLLHSFKWTIERKSKEISFNFSLSEEHVTLLEHSGFADLLNIKK
jgi:ABC-type transporter Mla MlaB component